MSTTLRSLREFRRLIEPATAAGLYELPERVNAAVKAVQRLAAVQIEPPPITPGEAQRAVTEKMLAEPSKAAKVDVSTVEKATRPTGVGRAADGRWRAEDAVARG